MWTRGLAKHVQTRGIAIYSATPNVLFRLAMFRLLSNYDHAEAARHALRVDGTNAFVPQRNALTGRIDRRKD